MKPSPVIVTQLSRESLSACEVCLTDLSDALCHGRTVKTQASTARRNRSSDDRSKIDRFWYQHGLETVALKIMTDHQLLLRIESADGRARSIIFNNVLPKTFRQKDLLEPQKLGQAIKACLESIDDANVVPTTEVHSLAMAVAAGLPIQAGQRIYLSASTPFHALKLQFMSMSTKNVPAPSALSKEIDALIGPTFVLQDANDPASKVAADSLHAAQSWVLRRESAFVDLKNIDAIAMMAHIAKGEQFDLALFREKITEKI